MKARAWSADDDDAIIEAAFGKVRLRAVAEELGRTEGAVIARRKYLGITNNGMAQCPEGWWTEYRLRTLREMVDDGFPDRRVAEKLGGHIAWVNRKRLELGLSRGVGIRPGRTPGAGPKWTREEVESVRVLLDAGKDDREIAERTGISTWQVQALRIDNGMRRIKVVKPGKPGKKESSGRRAESLEWREKFAVEECTCAECRHHVTDGRGMSCAKGKRRYTVSPGDTCAGCER